MKVLLSVYIAQNLGDDLFVKYICMRYPNVTFYLCCEERFSNSFKNIPNLHLINSLKEMNKVDLQILIGGSLFMQSSTKSILEKYNADIKLRLSNNIPFIILGANFGPYNSTIFKTLYEDFFKSVDLTVFRDKFSYELFPYSNVSYAPDILFNFPLPKIKKQKLITISCIKKNQRTGIPNYDEEAYLSKLSFVAEQYVNMGFKIILAAFCKLQKDDTATEMIYEKLSVKAKSNTSILTYSGETDDFLSKFLASSYIIGTRFHSIILGWSANIPVFPIAYNAKAVNAIISYGFKGNFSHINNFSNLDFKTINGNFISSYGIDSAVRKKALNHFLLLEKYIKDNGII